MNPDIPEIISSLNRHGVIYLVIGGYAVNLHGYGRMTEDVDILFMAKKENGQKLLTALFDAGFDTSPFSELTLRSLFISGWVNSRTPSISLIRLSELI
jgi:hypothetical protein